LSLPNDAWRLQWNAASGQVFRIEQTPELGTASSWTVLGQVTSTGASVGYDAPPMPASRYRFFRVGLISAGDDAEPPRVGSLLAVPGSVSAEGVVLLSVLAGDNRGIVGVSFYEGLTLLGNGTRVDGELWRFPWTVTAAMNGTRTVLATAMDVSGNRASTPGLVIPVQIAKAQETRTEGQTTVAADLFRAGGGGLLAEGSVRAGLASFETVQPPVLDSGARELRGNGNVRLPGWGTVFSGNFTVNLSTSELTGTPAARIELQPDVILRPRQLRIDVRTGALKGDGVIEVVVREGAAVAEGRAGLQSTPDLIAQLDGTFELDPITQTMTFLGTASYRDVFATGPGTVNVADRLFRVTGQILIGGPGGVNYQLLEGRMELVRPPDAEAGFVVEGRPSLASLEALGVRLEGTLALNGALDLRGSGSGNLDALRFERLDVTLSRAGLPGAVAVLRFSGPLALPRVGGTALSGTLLPGGAMTNTTSQAEPVTLGSLRIRPRSEGGQPQPVLRLLGSSGFRHTFLVRGEFLTPEENGVRPVEVTGPLVLLSTGTQLDVESMRLTNALPIPEWPLPKEIKLTNFSLLLRYVPGDFEARLQGKVRVTPPEDPTWTLNLDTALTVNPNDAEDVGFDAEVLLERLPLMRKAWLSRAKFRVFGGSKPVRGGIGFREANVGLFPTFPGTNAPAELKRDNFRVFVENAAASMEFERERFSARLTNGTLRLPTLFTNQPAGLCSEQVVASVGLGTNTAITLDFDPLPTPELTVRATGQLDFRNLTFAPGFRGFAAELCRASLVFNPGGVPYLTNLQGTVLLPLRNQTNRVELLNGAWDLLGFPSGTLQLASDFKVYEGHGMRFSVLGRGHTNCPVGTALTFLPGPGVVPPGILMDGAFEAVLPADLVTEVNGDTVRAVACARLALTNAEPYLPRLEVRNLLFGGNVHLGGTNGVVVTNGVLSFENVHNVFDLAPNRTVVVHVGGTLQIPSGPSFTLNDARFTLFDPARPPRFDIAGLGFDEREFFLAKKVPARLTKASFTFDNREAPLPQLLHPTNLNFTVSATLAFPTHTKPLFQTSVDDLKIDIGKDGAPIFKGIDGIQTTLKSLDIPPIEEIGGSLGIFGLAGLTGGGARALQSPPTDITFDDDLMFAGRLIGSYQGYKVNLILAFRPSGVVGACVDFNAGSAGIPLDAGYLGGILLTGASGGIAFGSGFIDPCEFTAYLGPDGKPKPGVKELPPITLDWASLSSKLQKALDKARSFAPKSGSVAVLHDGHDTGSASGSGETVDAALVEALATEAAGAEPVRALRLADLRGDVLDGAEDTVDGSGTRAGLAGPVPRLASFLPHARYTNEVGMPCPGDCPPPTINLFCQPHPDQDRFPRRVIARFSSIDEPTLNRLGFTREAVRNRFATGGDWAARTARDVSAAIRADVANRIPLPDPSALGPQAAEIRAWIEQSLVELQDSVIALLQEKLTGQTTADGVYDQIRDTVYGGATCQDITLSVSGTFTHSTVSSFLSGTVGATVTTAGSAGVSGRINLLGVPFGRAKGFIAGTDDQGNPNASYCADVDVSVGPLDLGEARASFAVPNGTTGSLQIFAQMVRCVGDELFVDAVRRVAPQVTVAGRTRVQIADSLTVSEKIAVIGHFYSQPSLPGDVRACFRTGLTGLMATVNPELLFCADVRPRLFGFEMGPSLYQAGFQMTKTNLTGIGSYSPSFMLAAALLAGVSSSTGGGAVVAAGPLATALFAQDLATYGFNYEWPDPLEPFVGGIDGRFSSPARVTGYLDETFDRFIENATYTFAYSLSPLGFKTVDTQMRVIFPNLTAHPSRPGSGWVRPESRTVNPPLPSRLDLVLSALTNRLSGSSLGLIADPKWKGSAGDLGLAFAAGSAERGRVAGLSFANDYFPHGGVLGGGQIQIPRALYEAPPEVLRTAVDPNADILTRLGAAADYLFDYVLQSRQAGALGFYLPAPNPPSFSKPDGTAPSRRELFDAIMAVQPEQLRTPGLFPASELFVKGWLDGNLLGVPVARASLEVAVADAGAGTPGFVRATGTVPAGSWLEAWTPGTRLEFDLRQSPGTPIEVYFQERLNAIRAALAAGVDVATRQRVLNGFLNDLQAGLPRVKLEAILNWRTPSELAPYVRLDGSGALHAYSARYEPGYLPGNMNPVARARRDGGMALKANLLFRVGDRTVTTVNNAELSVVPRGNNLPAVSGQFDVANIDYGPGLRNARIAFSTLPSPQWSARGVVSPLQFPAFSIEPLTGSDLSARLEVAGGANAQSSLFLAPARIAFGGLRATIRGASPGTDFGYSSTDPWSATMEFDSALRFVAAGVTVLELDQTGVLSPVTLSGQGNRSVEFSATMAARTILRVFPGRSYAQTFETPADSSSRLTVRSDGTFTLSNRLDRVTTLAGLPGLPVGTVREGSMVVIDQNGVRITGQFAGGLITQFGGATASVGGTVTLPRSGEATVALNAGFRVPAFGTPAFLVESVSGGDLTATVDGSRLALSGARVVVLGVLTNTLPPLYVDGQGNMRVDVGPFATGFSRAPLNETRYTLLRTNGVLSLTNLSASWNVPGLTPAIAVRGWVASDGRLSVTSQVANLNFGGHPLAGIETAFRRGASSVRAAVLADNPVAYWRFNEPKPGPVASETGGKFAGAHTGGVVASQPGAFESDGNLAIQLDGLSGRVPITDEKVFDFPGNQLTVEAWIRVRTFDRTWNTIVSKGDSSWRLQRQANTSALGFDTDGLNPPYLAGNRSVNDGAWHHVVAVYDGRAKYLWIDGELDAWTPATGNIAQNDFPVIIGENAQSTGRYWNGWIDDVAIYDRALAPSRVVAHHAAAGAVAFSASLRLGHAGIQAFSLDGALASNGAMFVEATPAALSLSGLPLQAPGVRFLRGPSGAATLAVKGNLELPGFPTVQMDGTIASNGALDIRGTASNAFLSGQGIAELGFRLVGTTAAGSLETTARMAIAGLGSVDFLGRASSNGDFSMTNTVNITSPYFGLPTASRSLVFERRLADYQALVRGAPEVPSDRGDDPVGYWRLGESSGTTANDSKKPAALNPAIPGTYVGGVTLGASGALASNTAARFDGVNDAVTLAAENRFDFTGPLTVETWLRVPSWTRTWQAIVTKGDSSWRLSRFGDTARISFESTSDAGNHSLPSVRNLDDGLWHHVVGIYDGAAKYLFVDGALEGFAVYDRAISVNNWPVMLGENAQAVGRFLNGSLDEVAIYGRALPIPDVLEHLIAGGGMALSARTRLALPGLPAVDLAGMVHPSGAAALSTSLGSYNLAGFTLGGAQIVMNRVPNGTASAAFSGTVSSPFGNVKMAGLAGSDGNFTLNSAPSGSLNIGGQTFAYTNALKLTRSQLEGTGKLTFGRFTFDGAIKVPPSGGPGTFSGTASATTAAKPFGKQANGTPGHPYAWVSWNASAGYDAPGNRITASVRGTLTVEYETLQGYRKKDFSFGPVNVDTTGFVRITPGESFNGIGTFDFNLP